MLDIALIRAQPDDVKQRLARLHDPEAGARVDRILELDAQRRELLNASESLQAQRNRLNRALGKLRGDRQLTVFVKTRRMQRAAEFVQQGNYEEALSSLQSDPEQGRSTLDLTEEFHRAAFDPSISERLELLGRPLQPSDILDETLVQSLRDMSKQYSTWQEQARATEADLRVEMLWLPNLPHASVPVAASEDDNRPWPPEGDFREFDVAPLPHWELAPALGILDLERGVKIAGSRGYVLRGAGARLQQALINFFLDQARAQGYEQVYVPLMVPPQMLEGSAQLPKFADTVYQDNDAGLYMLPTAEVALTNLHRDEILDESELPLQYVAHSPCFRREHMSAGRDTRGIKRVHQFEKVERYLFTTPGQSYAALETLTEAAEDLCRALQLPFRRLEIVTGDLGFSASKKYDVEVYAPGCDEWLEVSSCSNTEAFQARRANIRFRREGVKRPLHVHTLNGSALALPRIIIAILENYQNADGSVALPEVLVNYMGGERVIQRREAVT